MRLEEGSERELAREAWVWDSLAIEMVAKTSLSWMLDAGRNGRERTRGKGLDRLDEAIRALETRCHAGERSCVRQAREAFRSAEELRWRLAYSAVGVARQEARRVSRKGHTREDAMQDAMLGLFQAARRFDPDHGASFGTYARWWVRAALTKAVNEARTIRIPESALQLMRVMRAHQDEDPDASLQTLAEVAELPTDRASQLLAVCQPDSMDAPVPGAQGVTLGDTLCDESAEDPGEVMNRARLWELTLQAVAELDDRSREVVVRRYGLDDRPAETLAAIAEDFGVTPQRIRQIQKQAETRMTKLAAPA